MIEAFNKALDFTLQWEGEYSNHDSDPGGETLFGISQRAHPDELPRMLALWRQGQKDEARRMAGRIYQDKYWQPCQCSKMPDSVAVALFDLAVNVGIKQACVMLQRVLTSLGSPLSHDGAIGPMTIKALFCASPLEIAQGLLLARVGYYASLAKRDQYRPFLAGWINRVADLSRHILEVKP